MAFQTLQIAWYCVICFKLKILYYTQSTAGRCTTFADSKWNEYNNRAVVAWLYDTDLTTINCSRIVVCVRKGNQ